MYATAESSLVSAVRDGEPIAVEQGREQGHPVFRAGLEVEAGESTRVVLSVDEPADVRGAADLRDPPGQARLGGCRHQECGGD